MADKKISQLTALSAANVASATDVLAIVDTSATETKKITAKDLIDGALNGGTANGVLYLNGSKVATSGSALTFDGTDFKMPNGGSMLLGASASGASLLLINGTAAAQRLVLGTSGTDAVINATRTSGTGPNLLFQLEGANSMALTSTGLGIGTTSPGYKLQVVGTQRIEKSGLGYEAAMLSFSTISETGAIYRMGMATGGAFIIGRNDTSTTNLTLDTSGNVGIGTTNTTNGRVNIQAGTAATGNSAFFQNLDGTNNPYLQIQHSANGTKLFGSSSAGGAASNLTFSTPGGDLLLDVLGNLGLGVTPSAWVNATASQVGFGAAISSRAAGSTASDMSHAAYWNGTNWLYQSSSVGAARYQMTGANAGSTHAWFTSVGGTAGNTISFTQALTLDANINLLLNGTTAPASGVGTFAIFNGTAPTGSVTNGCVLYAEDVSSSSELKVRDEAGNVTTLSPHNFSLIPEGASEDMAWAYYSEKGGKRINVDMLKLARMVEKLTGEKLVWEA
jgi:hypothetical protein